MEFLKLLVAILGSIVVAWYWNKRRHELERYRCLDESCNELLRLYLEHPRFGDPALTAEFDTAYRGEEGLKYHYFAMQVHTTLETMVDMYGADIPYDWQHLFAYHVKLHSAWLEANRAAFRPCYLERARRDPRPGAAWRLEPVALAPAEGAS